MTAVTRSIVRWTRILRLYAFPVVVVPLAAVISLGVKHGHQVAWPLVPLLVMGLVCLHAGINLVNDYYDFMHGVDQPGDTTSTWALTSARLTPQRVRRLANLLLSAAVTAALPLIWIRGSTLAVFMTAGLIGGHGYTAPPLRLKYRGMGEVTVFLLSGPLLTSGMMLALTGQLTATAWWYGIPCGLLSSSILYVNNLRDRKSDAKAGFRTLPHRLGPMAGIVFPALILATGFMLWPLSSDHGLHPVGAVVAGGGLLAFGAPVKAACRGPLIPSDIDRKTAQAYLAFGAFFCLAILV